MSAYDIAAAEYRAAEENLFTAEALAGRTPDEARAAHIRASASDWFVTASANLRMFESSPGIPLPEYLTGAAA